LQGVFESDFPGKTPLAAPKGKLPLDVSGIPFKVVDSLFFSISLVFEVEKISLDHKFSLSSENLRFLLVVGRVNTTKMPDFVGQDYLYHLERGAQFDQGERGRIRATPASYRLRK